MATAVIMPRQGQSVESCIITKWHKKEGDKVSEGDILFTYETDKSTFDEEAKVSGVLLKVLRNEDDDVPCLENVCIIGEAGEDISSLTLGAPAESKPEIKAEEKPEEKAEALEKVEVSAVSAPAVSDGTFVKASPRAKALAGKIGVDFRGAAPTGAEGRIIERDVDELAKRLASAPKALEVSAPVAVKDSAPAAVKVSGDVRSFTEEKLTNIRKVIAKQMLTSITTTCQLTHTSSFDATEILALRKKLKVKIDAGEIPNITLNDMVMFAVSRVLKKHRSLNAHFTGETMKFFDHVNLGMAVDTPRGLMVPTCFAAESLSLSEIAVSLKSLAAECQGGTISPDKLSGGTFTVSNLGSLGIEHFTPVLNAPQTGILGVNTITMRARENKDGEIGFYPAMGLSLTYDHRALDGAPASKFLKDLCAALENFTVTLAL